jgi:hypothetical protein
MYKLVLVDIDGTLLNDQLQVTERTRRAICLLPGKGVLFGIASGRSPYALVNLIQEWGIADAVDLIIGFNGSALLDVKTMKMSSFYPLQGEGIRELLEDLSGFSFNAGVYDKQEFHALKEDEISRKTAAVNHFKLVIDDLGKYMSSSASKVLVMAQKEEMDRIVAFYETHAPRHYHVFRSGDVRLECIHPLLTKSRGIQAACQKLGLAKDEVVTFGDMMNDFEMIRDYVGVAMGNADQRVKDVARFATADNNHDGIAVFLEQHVL